jgi:RHS repeat-associated protein
VLTGEPALPATTWRLKSHLLRTRNLPTDRIRNYYSGSTLVAMPPKITAGDRTGSSTLNYMLGDHPSLSLGTGLGSTAITTNSSGGKLAEIRYYPWGTERYTYGTTPTSYHFTGQRLEDDIGLYYYGARWYDPYLNRWIQPDSDVPESQGVQAYDRYAYANNNPVKYTDPTGHFAWLPVLTLGGALIGAVVNYTSQVVNNYNTNGGDLGSALTTNIDVGSVANSALAGAAVGFSVGVLGPAAVAVAGDAITGVGLITGSATIFTAGVSASEASITLGNAMYGVSTSVSSPVQSSTQSSTNSPNFIGTENGELIPVPNGATGPTPVRSGAGFQYTGGSGGNGFDPRVTGVRIMDLTQPRPPSPGYPNGYVSYSNASGQTVNPYTGRTITPSDRWWHIELK